MTIILIVVILLLIFGGGGYRYSRGWGSPGAPDLIWLLVVILIIWLVLRLLGVL